MIANSGKYRKKNGQRGYVMMNNFIFENKTKVYFGKGGVKEYLGGLLANFGETVMLAYGGGSIKRNGVYDEIMGILNAAGKRIVEFSGIMSNPTYAKVQEGAKLARENHVDLILAVGGGSVSDCCKVISGAFDTLSHAMETYFGKPDENNLSDDINEAVMRSVIRNIRILLTDPEKYDARSELAQASAMAENGVLKIGKVTDFQAHQIQHQLGAYTNCNHGAGLAVIHPVLYRHIYKSGAARFARFAQNVWGIAPKGSDGETAAGIDALAAFIKEIGLPTSFAELGIPADTDFRAVADSTNITAGCCKKLTHDEIYKFCRNACEYPRFSQQNEAFFTLCSIFGLSASCIWPKA